jgi:hypothetical protein
LAFIQKPCHLMVGLEDPSVFTQNLIGEPVFAVNEFCTHFRTVMPPAFAIEDAWTTIAFDAFSDSTTNHCRGTI